MSVNDVDAAAHHHAQGQNGTLTSPPAARRSAATAPHPDLSGTPAQINAALASLTYPGNLDFNGADTLTVSTVDGARTDTDTVAITVNPVNDAPVNTVPGAQSGNEDTRSRSPGSRSTTSTAPSPRELTVTNGALNVAAGGAATHRRQRRRDLTSGTQAQINAALASLTYQGNPELQRRRHLTVSTSDGALSDSDTVAITVAPVNDAPVNTVTRRAERQRGHGARDPRRSRSTTSTATSPPPQLDGATNGTLNVARRRRPVPVRPARTAASPAPVTLAAPARSPTQGSAGS